MDHRLHPRYLARKRHLRDIWTVTGLIMLTLPPGGQLSVALLLVFLSFAYLDERPYPEN